MKKLFGPAVVFLFIVLLVYPEICSAQTPSYKVTGKIIIGGPERWDYLSVDTSMERLYIGHMSEVNVIDLNTDSLIGTIGNLNHVHGAACAPEFGKGYISNGGDASVTVFVLKSLKVIKNVPVTGRGPDAIVYDPFTKRIFTFNGRSGNATAIDARTDTVIGTVKLDGGPEFAVSDGMGKMYVNLEDESSIEEFDPAKLEKVATWSIDPCKSPSGLAIDAKNGILFSGCRNEVMAVVNAKNGKLIDKVPIGKGVDACRFDPVSNLAFSSTWDGKITVINEEAPGKYSVLDNVLTEKGARTMALDLKTHKLYTATMLPDKNGSKKFGVLILSRK